MNKTAVPTGNVFRDDACAADSIKRLRSYGITNIRWSLLEQHGIEKLDKDLNEVMGCACRVRICYDSHTPMDFVKYVYCGDECFTVRIPIMPTVIIEKIKRK